MGKVQRLIIPGSVGGVFDGGVIGNVVLKGSISGCILPLCER